MKFYPLLFGSMFFIILGSKIVPSNDLIEQTANVATLAWGLRCSGTENRVKPLAELLLTLIP